MAEVIDELLVKLGLQTDAKDFRDAKTQLDGVRSAAIATGAGIVAAFGGMVKMSADVAKSADELAKWSRTAGVTAQYASKLGYAMRQVGGGDADALGLIELTNSLRDSAQWGELADRAFTAAGFNPQRIEQERMSPEQVIEFLSQGLSSMQLDQRRQIAESLGIGDKAFRLLSDRQGMQSNFQRADELGGIPTDELLANAEAFMAATGELIQTMDGFKNAIAGELLPGMTRIIEGAVGFSVENRSEIEAFLKEAMPYLQATATGIGLLVAAQLGQKGVSALGGAGGTVSTVAKAGIIGGALSMWNWTADDLEEATGIRLPDWLFTPIGELGGDSPKAPAASGTPARGKDGRVTGSIPDSPETKAFDDAVGSIRDREDALFAALINQESGGRHRNADGSLLRSRAGALGITQIMPETGRDPGYGIQPLQDDSEGEYLRFGKEYLSAMLQTFDGDVQKALAAYNAGAGTVQKAVSLHGDNWLSAMPEESQGYVPSILAQASRGAPEFSPQQGQPKSGPTNYYAIDARGSTDPAATEAAVRRVVDERIASAVQIGMDDFPSNVK